MSGAREATEALRRLVSRVEASGSGEIEERSAEALDELARLADLLGRTVEDVVGQDAAGDAAAGTDGAGADTAESDTAGPTKAGPDTDGGDGRAIQALADELAAAIAARRHARPQ